MANGKQQSMRLLTTRRDPGNSAHLDKRSKQHNAPREFELRVRSAQTQSALPLFSGGGGERERERRGGGNTDTCFVYTTIVLGQPGGLSKEVFLYAGADWLSSSVCHRVARGRYSYETEGVCVRMGHEQ